MMGVQILEGDWNAEVEVAAASGRSANPNKNPSARQRRWTAFRSWYRGGRVFDRADETLIAAAMLRRPPSPGSQGRPLTPRLTPADGPRPAAPTTFGEEEVSAAPATAVDKSGDGNEQGETVAAAAASLEPTAGARAEVENTVAAADKGTVPGHVTPIAGIMRGRKTTPPAPPEPPGGGGAGSTLHVTLLKTDQSKRARTSSRDDAAAAADGPVEDGRAATEVLREQQDRGIDTARLAGIAGWGAGEDEVQADEEAAGTLRLEFGGDEEGGGLDGGRVITAMPTMSREGGTATAKRLRMEARRKFLAARTVTSKQAASKVRI